MVAKPYNPNNPAVLGDEWFTTVQSGYQLGDGGAAIALDMTAQFTDVFDALWFYLGPFTAPGTGVWQSIVYRAGEFGAVRAPAFLTFGTANLFTPIYSSLGAYVGLPSTTGTGCMQQIPSFDVARTNVTGFSDNTNLFFNVDDDISLWNIANYIDFTANNSRWEWRCNTNATRRSTPGRQVAGVLMGIYARQGVSGSTLTPSIKIDGVYYQGAPWQGGADSNPHYYFYEWTVNPATGLPWTGADIDELSDGVTSFRLKQQMGATGTGWRVYESSFFINFMDEYRIALGTLAAPELEAWNEFSMATPDYFNQFTADEASFETSTANWVAGSDTTIVQSGTEAFDGAFSLRLRNTSGIANDISARSTQGGSSGWPMPVTAGTEYYYQTQVRAATTSRTATPSIIWLDSTYTPLGTSTGFGVADSNAGWTQLEVNAAVAPAGAAFAYVRVAFTATANLEIHYVDGNIFTVRQHAQPGWTPGGAAQGNVPVTTGDDLFALFYKLPGGNGGPSVNLIDSGSAIPMPPGQEISTYLPRLASAAGWCTDAGDVQTFGFGLLYLTSGSTQFGDLPYARIDSRFVSGAPSTALQLISVPVAQDYGYIRCVVSLASEVVTEPLTIKVIQNSGGNPQVGPTFTITPDDVPTPRTLPQVIGINPSAPVPLTITGLATYYIFFESDDLEGWNIWLQDPNGASTPDLPGLGDLTYGGTDEFAEATFSDPGDDSTDFMVTIATLPDTPDCFSVVTV